MANYTQFKNALAERITQDDIEVETEELDEGQELSQAQINRLNKANRDLVDYIFKGVAPEVITDLLKEGVEADGKAAVPYGFGKVSLAWKEARKGRNPQTGEEIDIPARWGSRVTATGDLKEAVSNLQS